MSFDDDMKNRFQNQTPTVSNLDKGAAAAASSAARRTVAARGIAAIAFFAFIGLGALALTSGGETNSLDVAGNQDESANDEAPVEDGQDDGESVGVPEETSGESEELAEDDEAIAEQPEEPAEVNDEATNEPEPIDEAEEPIEDSDVVLTVGDEMVFRVIDVASDDTLNARAGAGTDNDVTFEFAPDATGVVRTESAPELVGTAEWVEVYGPISGTRGWVNHAFLEPIDVLDGRPCVFDDGQASANAYTNTDGGADSTAAVSTAMDTFRFGSCIRTVIEFSDGFSPSNPVTVLPNDITISSGAFDGLSIIDLGPSIIAAEAADERFIEDGISQSIYIHRVEGGNLTGLIYGPSSNIEVAFDNSNGRIIIDVADIGAATGVQPLLEESGVVVTDVFSGPDGVTISGLARPFEATLGVEVLYDGNPIDVDWTSGAVNSGTASNNGVMTTDWSSAWGAFDFTIDVFPSVNPFELVVRVDPSGGAADDPVVVDIVLEDLLN